MYFVFYDILSNLSYKSMLETHTHTRTDRQTDVHKHTVGWGKHCFINNCSHTRSRHENSTNGKKMRGLTASTPRRRSRESAVGHRRLSPAGTTLTAWDQIWRPLPEVTLLTKSARIARVNIIHLISVAFVGYFNFSLVDLGAFSSTRLVHAVYSCNCCIPNLTYCCNFQHNLNV